MKKLKNRYLPPNSVDGIFKHLETTLKGYSGQNRLIKVYKIGYGDKKVLAWSQMHGNESTATRGLIGAVKKLIDTSTFLSKQILDKISFYFIVQLNPDGSYLYTRFDSSGIDLNRDAQNLLKPESQFLRECLDKINPCLCLNLHDQRTIFNVSNTSKPATISFLSPAFNISREVNHVRKISMRLIVGVSDLLQKEIPNQIGRYDDSFNINCVGDMFTFLNKSVILFEAGHYQNDYERNKTSKVFTKALIETLRLFSIDSHLSKTEDDIVNRYISIPENNKLFFDILVRGTKMSNDKIKDIGILFREKLKNKTIYLDPFVYKVGDLSNYFGHQEVICDDKNSMIYSNWCKNFDLKSILDMFSVNSI